MFFFFAFGIICVWTLYLDQHALSLSLSNPPSPFSTNSAFNKNWEYLRSGFTSPTHCLVSTFTCKWQMPFSCSPYARPMALLLACSSLPHSSRAPKFSFFCVLWDLRNKPSILFSLLLHPLPPNSPQTLRLYMCVRARNRKAS
jgi:hypothetical protein